MPAQQPNWTHSQHQVGGLKAAIIQPDLSESGAAPAEMLVLCHGYGAPGDDLVGLAEPLIRQFARQDRHPVLVFPEAPIDMEEFGMPGARAWWPLNMARLMQLVATSDFDAMRNEVPPGIDDARARLVAAIELLLERFQIEPSALTLGGFSQGAMLAVDTTLRGLEIPPKRLVAMSGALICEPLWQSNAVRLQKMQVFQTHGRYDTILPIQSGRLLQAFFKAHCDSIVYREFDGPHTIPMEAIEMISR